MERDLAGIGTPTRRDIPRRRSPMHAVYRKPAGGVLVLAFTMLFDARSDPLAVPPAHDVLACGLAVLYSPFTSDPDRDGRRHRVLPGAFVESLASGAAISFTDESCDVPIELRGPVAVRERGGGRAARSTGHEDRQDARKWRAVRPNIEVARRRMANRTWHNITTRGTIRGVAIVRHPAYDTAELRTVR